MRLNKYRLLGLAAYYVIRLLHMTLRVTVVKDPDYDPHQQYLCGFWHGKQLLPLFELKAHKTPLAALTSSSRDGDILAAFLEKMGYIVIRGSSRRNNVKALAEMVRELKKGVSIGFAIDGPIGPIHKVKPGMTHMAQRLGIDMIPLGIAFKHKWVLKKAWDQFEIPIPFTKSVIYAGKPISVDKESNLEEYNLLLEKRIQEAEAYAASLLSR